MDYAEQRRRACFPAVLYGAADYRQLVLALTAALLALAR
jgi:hypothetical protein